MIRIEFPDKFNKFMDDHYYDWPGVESSNAWCKYLGGRRFIRTGKNLLPILVKITKDDFDLYFPIRSPYGKISWHYLQTQPCEWLNDYDNIQDSYPHAGIGIELEARTEFQASILRTLFDYLEYDGSVVAETKYQLNEYTQYDLRTRCELLDLISLLEKGYEGLTRLQSTHIHISWWWCYYIRKPRTDMLEDRFSDHDLVRIFGRAYHYQYARPGIGFDSRYYAWNFTRVNALGRAPEAFGTLEFRLPSIHSFQHLRNTLMYFYIFFLHHSIAISRKEKKIVKLIWSRFPEWKPEHMNLLITIRRKVAKRILSKLGDKYERLLYKDEYNEWYDVDVEAREEDFIRWE
ncbi:MAG: hypothetical protein J7L51_00010 [Desulfurococcales archaeon]|nr:hypothetical protein [Desulfurococcales archaeon]